MNEVVRRYFSNGLSTCRQQRLHRQRDRPLASSRPARHRDLAERRQRRRHAGRASDAGHELDNALDGHLQEQHPQRPDRRQAARPAARVAGRDADRSDPAAGADSNENIAQPAGLRPAVLLAGEPAHPAVGHARPTSRTCRRSRHDRRPCRSTATGSRRHRRTTAAVARTVRSHRDALRRSPGSAAARRSTSDHRRISDPASATTANVARSAARPIPQLTLTRRNATSPAPARPPNTFTVLRRRRQRSAQRHRSPRCDGASTVVQRRGDGSRTLAGRQHDHHRRQRHASPFSTAPFWVNGNARSPTASWYTCDGLHPTSLSHFTGRDRCATRRAVSRPRALASARTPAHRRLHQDREQDAPARRRLDRRHDGDPEPRHRRAESGRDHGGAICADPTPDAVLRLQRLRDNGGGSNCEYLREQHRIRRTGGRTRSTTRAKATIATSRRTRRMACMGGVMHYIALDVANLKTLVAGTTGTHRQPRRGTTTATSSTSRIAAAITTSATATIETGEYGFEDLVNPPSAAGTPDASLRAPARTSTAPGDATALRAGSLDVRRDGAEPAGAGAYDSIHHCHAVAAD